MSRRTCAGQTELWACPNCGESYVVEDTGERIRSRHYADRKVMRFYAADGREAVRCAGEDCGRFLHWLFNGVDTRALPGRAR